MLNKLESVPVRVVENLLSGSVSSTSVEVIVATAIWFSVTDKSAVSPPVISGGQFCVSPIITHEYGLPVKIFFAAVIVALQYTKTPFSRLKLTSDCKPASSESIVDQPTSNDS